MKVCYSSKNETVAYAAEELKKYIEMMDSSAAVTVEEGDISSENGIKLGLLEDFGLSTDGVEDVMLDDITDIKIENGKGYIAGSNVRSILLGVYEYLKSAGCMWPRPGKDGEYIPKYDILNHSFVKRHKASLRNRCQMIEGALKHEFLLDTIEWMPKSGYNIFYMQFVYPYNYYLRWYKHLGSTVAKPEEITYEQIEECIHEAEKLIRKCGMLLRSMGHGYLFEPYGVRYYGPTTSTGIKYEIPEQYKKYVAQVKGKRDVYGNSINFTQLCLSNPQVRKDCAEYLVSFAKKRKPDMIHVGLADAVGNFCECEECRKKMPSDWSVMLVNEVQDAFDREGIDVRLSFSRYVNTLWAPKYEKFKHPEKLTTGMGLSRSYERPLPKEIEKVPVPEFKLNDPKSPSGMEVAFAFHEEWKKVYNGGFTTTTYDNYSGHYADPGLQLLSKRTAQDIKTLTEHYPGFLGITSCQTQRFGFPTALPVALMGEMLTDHTIDYDEYTEKYFRASFGDDWKMAHTYLEKITELFNPARLVIGGSIAALDTGTGAFKYDASSYIGNPDAQADFKAIVPVVDEFMATVEKNMNLENPCHKKSWELLSYHGTYCKKLAAFYLAVSELDKERIDKTYGELMNWLWESEEVIGQFLDIYLLKNRRLDIVMGHNNY